MNDSINGEWMNDLLLSHSESHSTFLLFSVPEEDQQTWSKRRTGIKFFDVCVVQQETASK